MSIMLASFTAFVVKNAPAWLASLRGTVLGKSQEFATDKGKELVVGRGQRLVKQLFRLDEKEQLRHLEQALKNATERGLATFHTLPERDLYKDILQTLSQPGPSGEALRHEVMQFFTLEENPELAILNDLYNRRQRLQDANHQDIDVAPYLSRFFSALIGELYADPYFRPQLSDVLQQRANASMQRSLLDIVGVLKNIDARLDDNYSAEDFARDVDSYTTHIERTLRNLKIIGVVPKDQNSDPEIGGIFVPLRIALNEQRTASDQTPDGIIAALEQSPCLVLLGGPGSGKSTATKHLAWSHAAVNHSPATLASTPLLSGNPLPLRIELRRLNEERKRANYDFLSFTTDVLLKREGIEINPQMFKELLTRRCLLLLFDGLDEVATLNERLELVNEIEHFALSYPGNRVLVTSRPVGYDLSRISHPLFTHATVENFDDQQIQQFLHNWYTAVLRLSPIPQCEREEIDLLLTTLKGNPRLHKLAENPLLLTVIIQLHRYERLPDRRVLIYDRCADLLLETWAKLRGTDARWKDMKMVKEDQYACVAYLGFVLHERSQEQQSVESTETEEIAVDVSSRFLYHCVEEFLKNRELIVGLAEQRSEAKRFIALMQEEAGLIVERGTGENSEPLYGFVHRTFQEYFAAADVYERYQQEEDSTIISDFLRERLHDPHWLEVILLLLGKLKSKPVTKQLKDIFDGKTQSLRSRYTHIVQQDLFFVCDCLIEEIKVENSLIDMVVSHLCDVVRNGCFPSQQQRALEYLAKLMKTRQCLGQGKEELIEFAMRNDVLGVETRLYAIQMLYIYSHVETEERQLAGHLLRGLVEKTDLSVEQIRETVVSLYLRSVKGSETRQLATTLLKRLLERTDLSVEQIREIAESLYLRSAAESEAQQLAITMLKRLVERTDLSVEQIRETAESLYRCSVKGSETRQLATTMLRRLLERRDLSVEQIREIAESLYYSSTEGSEARQLATTMLRSLVERRDLSVEQIREIAESLYRCSAEGSETEQLATKLLRGLVERMDLSVEQTWETAEILYRCSAERSEAQQLAATILRRLVERMDLSVEQMRETAESLYYSSAEGLEAEQLATWLLRKLVEKIDLSMEQIQEMGESLYHSSSEESKIRQLALTFLKKSPKWAEEQKWKTMELLYRMSSEGSDEQLFATSIILTLISQSGESEIESDVYYMLQSMVPQFHKIELVEGHS